MLASCRQWCFVACKGALTPGLPHKRSLCALATTASGPAWFERKVQAAQAAIKSGLVDEETPHALFIDGSRVVDAIQSCRNAFAAAGMSRATHCFAVKANPTKRVLMLAAQAGMGLETASRGELEQALSCGPEPQSIVFDSPVKTVGDTKRALSAGVRMNIDNLVELQRLRKQPQLVNEESVLGVRLNPQVGLGTIAAFSTAAATSKFGVGLTDSWEELMEAYTSCPWLTMVHVHVGSQGVDASLAAAGIKQAVDFAMAVNQAVGRQQVQIVDIGGGQSVNFGSEADSPSFEALVSVYKEHVPELFTGEFEVITEFGRSIVAKAGFALSRVEFTKVSGGRHIALQHIGADLAVRTVYAPEAWPLRITVLDAQGVPRDDDLDTWVEQDIGGPCCIQGDIIAHKRRLPLIREGDWVIAHDVGGYYHASYSAYNARQCPALHGYDWDAATAAAASGSAPDTIGTTGCGDFTLLQQAQLVTDTMRFFSHEE